MIPFSGAVSCGDAGQVRQRRLPGGSLVEPMDRHDREELLDRPMVGRRLEDGEVAVVGLLCFQRALGHANCCLHLVYLALKGIGVEPKGLQLHGE